MEVNDDLEGFLFDNLASFFFQSSVYSHPVFYDRSFVKKDIDSIWIDLGAGMTQGAKDSSPINVFSEESCFHKRRMGNRLSSLLGIFLVSRPLNQDFNQFGCPLPVLHQTFCQILAHF